MAETATPTFIDALDEPIAEKAELVPAPPAARRLRAAADPQLELLKGREDRILEKSMAIIEGALGAAEVDDGQAELPQQWIKEFGLDGAQRLMRIAQDGRQNPKNHPVYLDLAKSVMIGIIKARASKPGETRSLNVSITLAAPRRAYDVIDLEPEPDK